LNYKKNVIWGAMVGHCNDNIKLSLGHKPYAKNYRSTHQEWKLHSMYTNHETKNYESQQHVLIASSWRFNFTCNKKMGGCFFATKKSHLEQKPHYHSAQICFLCHLNVFPHLRKLFCGLNNYFKHGLNYLQNGFQHWQWYFTNTHFEKLINKQTCWKPAFLSIR